MVFVVLDSDFQAFGNVRVGKLPLDLGKLGELRLTKYNHIQHRTYKASQSSRTTNKPHELSVPVGMVDEVHTRQYGCDICLLTLKTYEYWIRFPTDADATIFFRLLMDRIEAIIDDDGPEWPDKWESGGMWTLDVAKTMPEPSVECRCHQQSASVMKLMSKARCEEAARLLRANQEGTAAMRPDSSSTPPPRPPREKGEVVSGEEEDEDEEEIDEEEDGDLEEEDEEDVDEAEDELLVGDEGEVDDEEDVESFEDEDEDENDVPEEEFVLEEGPEALLHPLQVIFEEESHGSLPRPENLSQPETNQTRSENQEEEASLPGPNARIRSRQSRPSISPTNQHRPLRRRIEE